MGILEDLPPLSPEVSRKVSVATVASVALVGGIATFAIFYSKEQAKDRAVEDRAQELFVCSDEIYRFAGNPDRDITTATKEIPQSIRDNCSAVWGEFGDKTSLPSAFEVYGLATLEYEESKRDSAVVDVVLSGMVGLVGAILASLLPAHLHGRKYGQ